LFLSSSFGRRDYRLVESGRFAPFFIEFIDRAVVKIHRMAKQKFRPARRGGFSGVKAYIRYVEVLKKRCNAAGRTFCDAIIDRAGG
jgi:hypothetical protein